MLSRIIFAYYELGIHILTIINAKKHPRKVFSLGLTGNTHTQEGLALYGEYLSGSLTIERSQTVALRVIAVQYMLEQGDFVKTHHTLMNEFYLTNEIVERAMISKPQPLFELTYKPSGDCELDFVIGSIK